MDVLARLAALSEEQLSVTAARDDAAGVLAEWELAKRTGAATPTRRAVVVDGDHAIVAGPDAVERVALSRLVRADESGYTCYHPDGSVRGVYPTAEAAMGALQDTVGKATFVRKEDSRQFTLGPLYVPDFMDAHGEWTDPDELQKAAWEWVRSGDRRIFLQHDRTVQAGEWVEIMTMPQPWTVMMRDAEGNDVGEVTYPENTVFLGVVWNDTTWQDVKKGRLRGYSIGGFADRTMADLPPEARRPGVEME
jgi:hypothetical protein